jgi:hypothetical protein
MIARAVQTTLKEVSYTRTKGYKHWQMIPLNGNKFGGNKYLDTKIGKLLSQGILNTSDNCM